MVNNFKIALSMNYNAKVVIKFEITNIFCRKRIFDKPFDLLTKNGRDSLNTYARTHAKQHATEYII